MRTIDGEDFEDLASLYRSTVGAIQYLCINIRPDMIAFTINKLS